MQEGKSIVLITHKLKEIMEVCDRCTIIRKGKGIGTVDVANTDENKLAELMVGRQVNFKTEKIDAKPKRRGTFNCKPCCSRCTSTTCCKRP